MSTRTHNGKEYREVTGRDPKHGDYIGFRDADGRGFDVIIPPRWGNMSGAERAREEAWRFTVERDEVPT